MKSYYFKIVFIIFISFMLHASNENNSAKEKACELFYGIKFIGVDLVQNNIIKWKVD